MLLFCSRHRMCVDDAASTSVISIKGTLWRGTYYVR